MAMLTARYPYRQQVWTNDDMLASNLPTHAHALTVANYRTILIGRLHALGPDQFHGYLERDIGDHSPNWPGIARHNMGVLAGANDPSRASLERSGAGESAYDLLDGDTTNAAIARFGDIARARASGDTRPFAMTVGFMLPHAPYVADEADYQRFFEILPPPRIPAGDGASEHPWLAKWRTNRNIRDVSPDEIRRARAAYYALTYRLDARIGEVLKALKDNGLDKNTLILYTSDHGDQLGERGHWWKHTFYDDSVKVPLIVAGDALNGASGRRHQLVDLLDVSASLCDLADAPALPGCDGRSFAPLLSNPEAPWDNRVFSEYCMDIAPVWSDGEALQHRMLRDGDWKLNYYHGYPSQLFNLADDPDELNDLAGHPLCREKLQSMLKILLAGWDPEAIAQLLTERIPEKILIADWAREAQPKDVIRWPLTAEQNKLIGKPNNQTNQENPK
jgi:choline-sulfatase